jgi:hypothetical protein
MTVIVVVAGLTAAFPGSAAAAVPKCQGKVATIVGTKKDDVLRGTRRADVIVAKRGSDTIIARGGNDIICAGGGADVVRAGAGRDKVSGGAGADVLAGGTGPDVLRGLAGNDIITGGDGDDTVDGGLGFDTCEQGAGTGKVVNCEKIEDPVVPPDPPAPVASADLSVSVVGPKKAESGPVTFTVRVRNLGPDASAYVLDLSYRSRRATCDAPSPDWTGKHPGSSLDAGTNYEENVVISCRKQRTGASVTVRASVTASVTDPDTTNNAASARTALR